MHEDGGNVVVPFLLFMRSRLDSNLNIVLCLLTEGVWMRDDSVQRCGDVYGDLQPNLAHGSRLDAQCHVLHFWSTNRAQWSLQSTSRLFHLYRPRFAHYIISPLISLFSLSLSSFLASFMVLTRFRDGFPQNNKSRLRRLATLIWPSVGRLLRTPCTPLARATWLSTWSMPFKDLPIHQQVWNISVTTPCPLSNPESRSRDNRKGLIIFLWGICC